MRAAGVPGRLQADAGGRARRRATIVLPPPALNGPALADVLARRRSRRHFSRRQLQPAEIGQLCWAAQGLTGGDGRGRTAPSAGALYPLNLSVLLPRGLFRYDPQRHRLVGRCNGELHAALAAAALHQPCIALAPCVFVITAIPARSSAKYGERALRYIFMEAGHVAQNLLLQAVALGLAAVPVGAFDDQAVAEVLRLKRTERPLYLVSVGGQYPAATV